MPYYYFDCLINGASYPDKYGIEIPPDEIGDQAQGVMINIMEEIQPNNSLIAISVTVRDEKAEPVYVVHGVINGTPIRHPVGLDQSVLEASRTNHNKAPETS